MVSTTCHDYPSHTHSSMLLAPSVADGVNMAAVLLKRGSVVGVIITGAAVDVPL